MSDEKNWGQILKNLSSGNETKKQSSDLPKFEARTVLECIQPQLEHTHSEFGLRVALSQKNNDEE